jgi:hypothetical protein
MPTLLRREGFRVLILLPPREHPPAHVHVTKAAKTVVIQLAYRGQPQTIRENRRMADADVVKAWRLVAEFTEELIVHWERIHGSDQKAGEGRG